MFPSMLNKLIYSIGFDWAIRVAGFIVVGLLIFATLVIDARLPPRKSGRFLDFGVFKDLPFTVYTFGAAFVWLGLYLPIFVSIFSLDFPQKHSKLTGSPSRSSTV